MEPRANVLIRLPGSFIRELGSVVGTSLFRSALAASHGAARSSQLPVSPASKCMHVKQSLAQSNGSADCDSNHFPCQFDSNKFEVINHLEVRILRLFEVACVCAIVIQFMRRIWDMQ